jgi:predicted esterase
MPAWFDLYGLSPESPEDLEGIKLATQYAHTLVQREIDAGIDPKKIVIGGFSMGGKIRKEFFVNTSFLGALALHAALTLPVNSRFFRIFNIHKI